MVAGSDDPVVPVLTAHTGNVLPAHSGLHVNLVVHPAEFGLAVGTFPRERGERP